MYVFVYTFSRPALGKTHHLPVLPTPPSWAHLKSPWWPLLPIEWPRAAWERAIHVPCVSHSEPFLPPDALQAGERLSFWVLLPLVGSLSIATDRKTHEPASPKGEFLTRMQGCFMHFKGWEAARFQRLKLQIIGLSLPLLCCSSWVFWWLVFFFPLSLWNLFLYGIHMANTQLNRQNKCETKGSKHDSQ